MSVDFKINIPEFDGPLDLMLSLIHEQKLDILHLNVDILTDQYIAYLKKMQTLNLEIASEYLVELSGLLEIKSARLLPKRRSVPEESEDPQAKLVRRLLEYQQMKDAAALLKDDYEERLRQYSRPLAKEADVWLADSAQPLKQKPEDLFRAIEKLSRRTALRRTPEASYTVHEISIEDRELQVRAQLDQLPPTFRFQDLLYDCHSMPMFIATFLSVLDLARLHTLAFHVDEKTDEIWLAKGGTL